MNIEPCKQYCTHSTYSPRVSGERVPRGSREGKQGVYDGKECGNRCGNPYLPKGITKESEVADTKGSTATGAPL